MNLMPGAEAEPGSQVINYSPEIEAEVDAIYKQMYDEHITIDDVIGLLQRHKTSSNPKDHEIFSCMLHFLFDEYKFFQSFYPARELGMTGYLFGSLIQHQLVDYIPLGIAIRYVLDALQCPPETNLFKFGVGALIMRGAGCTINDMWDRRLDKAVGEHHRYFCYIIVHRH